MMSDDFIEKVITPKPQSKDEDMNREFYGMEAVQHAEVRDESEEGGDKE